MPTDRYTKIVLTVIAVALAANALEKVVRPTLAQDRPQAQTVWITGVNPDVLFHVSLDKLTGNVPVSVENVSRPILVRNVP